MIQNTKPITYPFICLLLVLTALVIPVYFVRRKLFPLSSKFHSSFYVKYILLIAWFVAYISRDFATQPCSIGLVFIYVIFSVGASAALYKPFYILLKYKYEIGVNSFLERR